MQTPDIKRCGILNPERVADYSIALSGLFSPLFQQGFAPLPVLLTPFQGFVASYCHNLRKLNLFIVLVGATKGEARSAGFVTTFGRICNPVALNISICNATIGVIGL